MSRNKKSKHRQIKPDLLYKSNIIAKLINKIMIDGKKSIAQKHVYKALDLIKEKTKKDPLIILRQAINNITPSIEVRSRRVGGAAYQVPIPVKGNRCQSLALKWLITSARSHPNSKFHHFYEKLTKEILDAYEVKGKAIEYKNQTHKIAKANKAFSHLRW